MRDESRQTEREAPSGEKVRSRSLWFHVSLTLSLTVFNLVFGSAIVAFAMWLSYMSFEAAERMAEEREAAERFLIEKANALRFERAQVCIADVLVVEAANLFPKDQRPFADSVINRARYMRKSWLDAVCDAAFWKHRKKGTADTMLFDYSGIEPYGRWYDYSRIAGWAKSYRTAYEALITALNPSYGRVRFAYVALDPRYIFYFTEGVDYDWFVKQNNAVCDEQRIYTLAAMSVKLHMAMLCRHDPSKSS